MPGVFSTDLLIALGRRANVAAAAGAETFSVPEFEPVAGTLLVHVGEILAFATQGYFCSTPHRVVNRLSHRSRLSIPIFLNPSLQTIVTPITGLSGARARGATDASHVHRVLSPNESSNPFMFGAAEWRRKGLNVWCTECVRE